MVSLYCLAGCTSTLAIELPNATDGTEQNYEGRCASPDPRVVKHALAAGDAMGASAPLKRSLSM